MADAAAPPTIHRTSAKLAGLRIVGTSTPSANYALLSQNGSTTMDNIALPLLPILSMLACLVVPDTEPGLDDYWPALDSTANTEAARTHATAAAGGGGGDGAVTSRHATDARSASRWPLATGLDRRGRHHRRPARVAVGSGANRPAQPLHAPLGPTPLGRWAAPSGCWGLAWILHRAGFASSGARSARRNDALIFRAD